MPRDEAIALACRDRLRPILMTTLATLGGMLPIAIGIEAGSETQAPLGTVVIGGLITSTLLGARRLDQFATSLSAPAASGCATPSAIAMRS